MHYDDSIEIPTAALLPNDPQPVLEWFRALQPDTSVTVANPDGTLNWGQSCPLAYLRRQLGATSPRVGQTDYCELVTHDQEGGRQVVLGKRYDLPDWAMLFNIRIDQLAIKEADRPLRARDAVDVLEKTIAQIKEANRPGTTDGGPGVH